jgi:cyclic pyranopterin phosphate synthase
MMESVRSRARLTIEGKLVTCLFAAGGSDLRGPLRAGASDDEMLALIGGVWAKRNDRYSEERAQLSDRSQHPSASRRIEMYQIGR